MEGKPSDEKEIPKEGGGPGGLVTDLIYGKRKGTN